MTDLTLQDVRERAERILELDRSNLDPEEAHGDQDDLYVDVLRAVADGHQDAAEMARQCLRVADQPNPTRWYA